MSYYKHHLFFCTNTRDDDEPCCQDYDSLEARNYMKRRAKDLDLYGKGKSRINTAGCMNRCSEGPVIAVYPDAVWYTWVDHDDLDEILESHLQQGKPVKRLMLQEQ